MGNFNRYARVPIEGTIVLVSYDAFGYWHAAAPGNGASFYGPRTAEMRDEAIRDAISRWRFAGCPSPAREGGVIPPGWDEVSVDDLLADEPRGGSLTMGSVR